MVNKVCHRAMSERPLFEGEELFRLGVRCSRMYFTISGESKYVVGCGDEEPYDVKPQQWLSEASLWVEWEHRGQLNAQTSCEISQLDAAEFTTLMTRSRCLRGIQRYARLYAHYAGRENGGAEFATDLWGQRMRVVELVQKAWGEEDPCSLAMLLWCDKDLLKTAWSAWKAAMPKPRRKKWWQPSFYTAMRTRRRSSS